MCHVLIIEDEALIALDLQDILAETGATSFAFAETEQDAIDSARLHRPDVITSDVMLREGTGPRAVEAIQLWNSVRVRSTTGTVPPGRGSFASCQAMMAGSSA